MQLGRKQCAGGWRKPLWLTCGVPEELKALVLEAGRGGGGGGGGGEGQVGGQRLSSGGAGRGRSSATGGGAGNAGGGASEAVGMVEHSGGGAGKSSSSGGGGGGGKSDKNEEGWLVKSIHKNNVQVLPLQFNTKQDSKTSKLSGIFGHFEICWLAVALMPGMYPVMYFYALKGALWRFFW